MNERFATAINCMDGRAQRPVTEYIRTVFGVDYVDMITEPGPVRILAEDSGSSTARSLKDKTSISVDKHASRIIVVAAHWDCAGNPVEENTQKAQLKEAAGVIVSWRLPVDKIVALWLDERFQPSSI